MKMCKTRMNWTHWFIGISVFSFFFIEPVCAQNEGQLEKRMDALENSVQSSLNGFAKDIQNNLSNYTKQLETGLDSYSKSLEERVEARLQNLDRRTVVLNITSQAFQRIDTNTGIFLIAVEKFETIPNGIRLHINIGNPNNTDYKNFKLRFYWGQKWAKNQITSYEDWRKSLQGAEFSFQGNLQKGAWNPISIDMASVKLPDLEYIECEMDVLGIEMPIRK